jgi:hypothetical protein
MGVKFIREVKGCRYKWKFYLSPPTRFIDHAASMKDTLVCGSDRLAGPTRWTQYSFRSNNEPTSVECEEPPMR